jgi:hypothetical protein
VFSILFAFALLAQTAEKSENDLNGIKEIKPGFQVFPDGKLGNTLYADKKKLISREDLVLKDVLAAPEGYVYFGVNEVEEGVLGYVGPEKAEFKELEGKYYSLLTSDGKRLLYQVTSKNEIQNLLPRSNTASGLVHNKENKAAFFHITKGETIETEEGKERYQYTFKIHIVRDRNERVTHLSETVSDFRSRLRMRWLNKNTLQYILSNGQKETIVIK